ncbi:MAG: hypothetical protein V1926_02970 [Candidatus Peregrinibacteria bacterium]
MAFDRAIAVQFFLIPLLRSPSMPSRASSRFTPLLFWGAIVLVALVASSLSLRKTFMPLRGQVQPPPPQVIDHHSPRPSFKLFGPWYRTKNFDFTRARWTSKAQYNFSNIQPGIYKVEASYLPYALFTQAPYTIKEGENILAEASVDQSAGATPGTRPIEQWVQIATDLTINGPDLTVEVTSPATPGATASIMARGMRLTYLRAACNLAANMMDFVDANGDGNLNDMEAEVVFIIGKNWIQSANPDPALLIDIDCDDDRDEADLKLLIDTVIDTLSPHTI